MISKYFLFSISGIYFFEQSLLTIYVQIYKIGNLTTVLLPADE